MTNQIAELPLILPLMDRRNNKPMTDAYRLIFSNVLIVYYSYQHPIAFAAENKLAVRATFWDRPRGSRETHKQLIIIDANLQFSVGDDLPVYTKDFFIELQGELRKHGITFMVEASKQPQIDVAPVQNKKRRIVL